LLSRRVVIFAETLRTRALREGSVATWVVYHDESSPDFLEYVIKDIPEGITKKDIQQALSVTKDCHMGNPRREVAFSLHGICKLNDAPEKTQSVHAVGQATETFHWIDLWKSSGP
jgi:hypothetical protein